MREDLNISVTQQFVTFCVREKGENMISVWRTIHLWQRWAHCGSTAPQLVSEGEIQAWLCQNE